MKLCGSTLVVAVRVIILCFETAFAQHVADWEPCTTSADCSSALSCCTGLYSDGVLECAPLDGNFLDPYENGCVEAIDPSAGSAVTTTWSCFQKKDPSLFLGYVDLWRGHEASDASGACDEWIDECQRSNGGCLAVQYTTESETGDDVAVQTRRTEETLYPTVYETLSDDALTPYPTTPYWIDAPAPSPDTIVYYPLPPSLAPVKLSSPKQEEEKDGSLSRGTWIGLGGVAFALTASMALTIKFCSVDNIEKFVCFDCRRGDTSSSSTSNLSSSQNHTPTLQGKVISSNNSSPSTSIGSSNQSNSPMQPLQGRVIHNNSTPSTSIGSSSQSNSSPSSHQSVPGRVVQDLSSLQVIMPKPPPVPGRVIYSGPKAAANR